MGEGCLYARLHVGPSDRLLVVLERRGFGSAATTDRVEDSNVLVSAAVAETPPCVRVEKTQSVISSRSRTEVT
jgi:hypothetical protein